MILTGTKPKALSRTGRLALLALGAALLPLLPGPAKGERPGQEEPQRDRTVEDRRDNTPAPAPATTEVAETAEVASARAGGFRTLRGFAFTHGSKKQDPLLGNSRRIRLDVDRAGQPRLRKPTLFVSSDGGRTWDEAAEVTPDQKAFRFNTPADGPYLFAIQTEDQDGRRQPAVPGRSAAALKVWVDTRAPAVSLGAQQSAEGNLEVEWEARDDNLDLASLALEWRRVGEEAWRSLWPGRMAAGQLCWKPAPRGPVEVRLRVRDRAGNSAEKMVKVPGGR